MKFKNLKFKLENAFNLIIISALTGLCSGVIITLYNILAHIGEDASVRLYDAVRANPAFVPLLLAGLAAGGILIGTAVRFVPMIRGSGIPQIEGAARGVVPFKWYVTLCSMFAASLACIFMGLSAGAEGPSLEIGGCVGSATSNILKRNVMVKRLQIASGASAAFAVAFNAPVTGMVFAMEEAFRSFSPQVFVSAAVSVIFALLTRNALRPAMGYGTGVFFDNFVFAEYDAASCLWIALGVLLTSLAGVAFYYCVFAFKNIFKRFTFLKGAGKYAIPFVAAGCFGLITSYAMGGGHTFIQALSTGGTGDIQIESVLGAGVAASIIIVVLIKFTASVLVTGCGVPCGVFIPMLSIGAGFGAIFSLLFQAAGMDASFSDALVIICMSAFFTTVVKAPVTGIIMVFELTGQFSNLIPALIGTAVSFIVSGAFGTEPIYERLLSAYIEDEKIYAKFEKLREVLEIMPGSKAAGKSVRTVIWPVNGLIIQVERTDGTQIVPDGETILQAGDIITFECETDDENSLLEYLYALVGKPQANAD